MLSTVSVPLIVLLILTVLSATAVYRHLLPPTLGWMIRRRSQRVVDEVNSRLQLQVSQFSLTRRRILADRLAYDAEVSDYIKELAGETRQPVATLRKQVTRIAYEIVPAFSPYFYFRVGYWSARALLRFMYKVRLGYMDSDGLAKVSDDSAVVFFMNHRTNIDYVLATYMTATRSTMSYGIGEWAKVWPIQPLMRAAGGYFLRRDSGDPLYRKVLERFVQMLTQERVPHALFVEGALSRDGYLQKPKLGMLTYITRDFDPNASPDIVFIPIGTNYERIPEERTLIARASDSFVNAGNFFILRSAGAFIRRVIGHRLRGRGQPYGYACANYGSPVSFTEWLRQNSLNWPLLDRTEKFEWIGELADELQDNVRHLVPVLPTSILCAIFQHCVDAEYTEAELRRKFDAASTEAQSNGGHVLFPNKQSVPLFEDALEMLLGRKLLQRNTNGAICLNFAERPLIGYYSNSIIHFIPSLEITHA